MEGGQCVYIKEKTEEVLLKIQSCVRKLFTRKKWNTHITKDLSWELC